MEDDLKLRIRSLELAVEYIGRTNKKYNGSGLASQVAIICAKEFHKFLSTPIEVKK